MHWATADLLDNHPETAVFDHGLRSYGGMPDLVGRATLIQAPADNTHVRSTLERPGEGRVLVVEGEGVMSCALVGDRLAQLAIDNGWAGILINGCIRDSGVIASMPIGIWALGTNPRRSSKQNRGGPVPEASFLGVVIQEGDWIYADADGILVARHALHAA
ncbi:MAG: ribonuclease E activity regulator RraA [Acidimicrobiia bacterium]|nr:ribonuclease E activity regulator RraA [Acidimicrobiia bacterium]MBT8250055.1 ribonuclease E activity regulator RraA [Acidimicrobiia bacterium]NNC42931.1 ribonuclease E activity regulator RraA [Acidimicrobiia bacterium]NND13228.1 ribonuclease E activity regulator RraA [Acidimicrobiia bacterium]NNL28220.1 ribonuclease E activity regulator RraA [Acidimicrobiia bacterium]